MFVVSVVSPGNARPVTRVTREWRLTHPEFTCDVQYRWLVSRRDVEIFKTLPWFYVRHR